MSADRSLPWWTQRLIELRRSRAWSPADLAYELKKRREGLPSVRSLAHMIQLDWETGKHHPGPRYRLLLAAVYDTGEEQIFGDQAAADAISNLHRDKASSVVADLGDQLRHSIVARGLSVRATARQAGCSPGYLSNVIHGRRPLTPSVAARLDRVLNTGGTLAARALNWPSASNAAKQANGASRHAAGTAGLDRRQAAGDDSHILDGDDLAAQRNAPESLSALTAADLASPRPCLRDGPAAIRNGGLLLRAAELAAFGIPESWPRAAATAGKVTEDHVLQVETATAVFRSWDNAYGGGLRRKAVIGQLAEVTSLLAGPFASAQTARRLYSAIADLAQLAGWMSWDLQLHATAQDYYLLALALARDADDRPQVARLMYCLARQQIDLGHPGEALELAAAGAYATRRTPSPRASALVHIGQARAYACLGEEQNCRTALGVAQQTYARDGIDPAWCGFFDEAELSGLIGVTLRDLAVASPGQVARIATEARAWIEQAATARPSTFLRSKVLDTDGIAITSILARDPERAAAAAGEAISLSRQVHSPRTAARLQATITMGSRVFSRDAPWDDLGEQVRALTPAR
jgi:transcriptional regulator with XRE-family HTH domain